MRVLLLISLLLLTGCDLFSDKPVAAPARESIDGSQLGTWTWNAGSDRGFVHIGTDAGRVIAMAGYKNAGRMDTAELTGQKPRNKHLPAEETHVFEGFAPDAG